MQIKYSKSSGNFNCKNLILNKSPYPFFSIIIPTLNSGSTLEKTLNSLSIQQYRNFEIIIIDGVSADDTLKIIEEFNCKEVDIRVKVISERDNGIYDAMNKGISVSSGKYINFLGSDDQLNNEKTLGNISGFLLENPSADIIYGNRTLFNGNYGRNEKQKRDISYRLTFLKILNKMMVFLKLCSSHQVIFAKRELLYEGFSLNYRLASDLDWILRQRERKKTFKYINEDIVRFNISGASSDLTLLFPELINIIKNHYCNPLFRKKSKREN